MHPSFRHVFGGEEITPEPPAVILHFGAHSSSFQVSGQFQPSKNILPNLYGKWMAMIIVIGRDFLILYHWMNSFTSGAREDRNVFLDIHFTYYL